MRISTSDRKVHGGAPCAGAPVGILLLDTRFPRIAGDLGNAETFPFPVLYKVVPGASPDAVVCRGAEGLADSFRRAAVELVAMGARGIVCNCGFLAGFQQLLSEASGVPVLSSSLMQVAAVQRLLPPGRRAGVLTVSAATLSAELLSAAGVPPGTPIAGTDRGAEFSRVILGDEPAMDMEAARADVVAAAVGLAEQAGDLGAIVLECTNMSPYADSVRAATGLPVATPYGLVCWFHSLLAPRVFLA